MESISVVLAKRAMAKADVANCANGNSGADDARRHVRQWHEPVSRAGPLTQ